jgi:hypothetical protein
MELVLGLIGGLGAGSILTAVATHFMTRQAISGDRRYQEKREAYLGLLNAIHDAAIEPSDEHSKAYALWQTRCELFGSPDVSNWAQKMVDTNDGPRAERDKAFRRLIEAMRADLSS